MSRLNVLSSDDSDIIGNTSLDFALKKNVKENNIKSKQNEICI